MKQFSILTFCLISAVAPAIDGQTNAPVVQNTPPVAANSNGRARSVHPNAPVSENINRGLVNFSPRTFNPYANRTIGRSGMNSRSNYSPFVRPLNPTLAAMNARQTARTYNLQANGNTSVRREISQTPLSIANARRVVRADNLRPSDGDLAMGEMSQRPGTIGGQRIARNNNVQPTVRDLGNRETTQHTPGWNRKNGKNRFSYSDALRHSRREWHNCNWWKQHFTTIVFVNSGYYYLDASYWYPAWGYDPLNNYYDNDGPIYTYGNLLPDQVIANVQVALQDAGYYAGPITGSLNIDTRVALANYQRDQGLLITGAIDQPTVESLGLY